MGWNLGLNGTVDLLFLRLVSCQQCMGLSVEGYQKKSASDNSLASCTKKSDKV